MEDNLKDWIDLIAIKEVSELGKHVNFKYNKFKIRYVYPFINF